MVTLKSRIDGILRDTDIDLDTFAAEYEGLGTFLTDILRAVADDTEEHEPYATVTIRALRDAASSVFTALNDLGPGEE